MAKATLGEVEYTGRGFEIIGFKDYYGAKCSLQQSSAAIYEQPGTGALWLGVDDPAPQILKTDALRLGLHVERPIEGWMPYEGIPKEVMLTTRMHLNLEQVKALIGHLQCWVQHGNLSTLDGK